MRVLVTGASGFVGGAVIRRLSGECALTRAAVRRPISNPPPGIEQVCVDLVASTGNWNDALNGIDAVVHASARVHVMRESTSDPLAEFRRVNVAGTLTLARKAAKMGVGRFVFISSVKVYGESTSPGRPFLTDDKPAPVDAYGTSKLEAEQGLRALAGETGLELVIVRPVLVYGPGVKGNFRAMMRWLHRGFPLPFGAVQNRRSFVALDNLVDLISVCLRHPEASGQVFLAADGEDLSTPELLRRTAAALGRRPRLVPVPVVLVRGAAALLGRADVAERLCGYLQVDISETQRRLSWEAPVSVDESLSRTARHFLIEQAARSAQLE